MHVIIIITPNGLERAIVSARKKNLRLYIDTCKRQGWTWRYHNGDGWADGSVDAWQHIKSITGSRPTEIVY